MTGVIIAASNRDRNMWNILPGILSRNFPTISASGSAAAETLGEAKFVICAGSDMGRIQMDSAVVIYKDADGVPDEIPAGMNAVAVVDSGNPQLMELVRETKLPAITCGLSPRDTLTLTSFGEDSAMLGLQRLVTCFDGTVAEPQEIPLKLS